MSWVVVVAELFCMRLLLQMKIKELVTDTRRRLTAKEGFANLALYLASMSRFPTAPGPFLYSMYGQGDLTQAFCCCAVETKDYRGVETVSGPHLYSGKLITGPSFCVGSVQPRLTEDRGSEEGTAQFSSSDSQCYNNIGGVSLAAGVKEGSTDKGSRGMPDGTLDYKTMMALTEIVFHKLFPEQDFLTRAVVAANNVED
ncbi:unnamed protein product [Sphagnum jensenii]|uniref:Uncharacterized protein n=1 Tax=Sphagnum jensenii TaxID=128206 RepID=A0ABP1C234_9BRYO